MRRSAHSASTWPALGEQLRRHKVLSQLGRYAIVSALALALDFAVFLALNDTLGHPTLAGVVGYGTGIGLHFLLSRRFVFDAGSAKAVHRLFVEFAASGLVGLAITAAVIGLATGEFGLAPIVAKMLAAGASFLGVFLIRRTVVFA